MLQNAGWVEALPQMLKGRALDMLVLPGSLARFWTLTLSGEQSLTEVCESC